MQAKTFQNAPVFEALQGLAVIIQTGTKNQARAELARLEALEVFQGKKAWQSSFGKLAQVFETLEPQFKIFAMGGNKKLPFVAFSTLPGVTCPGAGDCIQYCYSYRAWRYPAAFARQAQNAFLMRHNRAPIAENFRAIVAEKPEGFDFRLYVDGDFSSADDVHFWMHHLTMADRVRAYGYSKSFAEILAFDATGRQWPGNYLLNVSGGHNASPDTIAKIKDLPITRGDFIAVNIGRIVKSSDHGKPKTNKDLREAFGKKAFPCPGQCGACTGAGHACGLNQLRGVPIIIAVH